MELIERAWAVRRENFPPVIRFDLPRKTAAVSLTGPECALDCAHCGGNYLKAMTPIDRAFHRLGQTGAASCLISGGCNREGAVDFRDWMDHLRLLRKKARINIHAGLVKDEDMEALAQVADCVSFDFVADDETIREVYGLSRTAEDYIRIYRKLQTRVKVLPHICIGLKGGEISGEYKALKALRDLGAEGLVFIIFMPTPGTRYADRKPPALKDIVRILATARVEFPHIPIHLGCMRPKGSLRAEIDDYAVRCGVNKLVMPTPRGETRARELGLTITYGEECCVL